MRRYLLAMLALATAMTTIARGDTLVRVFDSETLHSKGEDPILTDRDDFVIRHRGQQVERSLRLPPAPDDQAEAQRIVAIVRVQPIYTETNGRRRANDPWPRIGHLALVSTDAADKSGEIELMRFVTGFGGPGVFEHDLTPMAPLLYGERTLRAAITTYSETPGWRISVELLYTREGVGQRRPTFAAPVLHDLHVGRDEPVPRGTIVIPRGVDRPRLRILSTGHATDGQGRHEFVSATHVLRVDGQEIARWRPWAESGGMTRDLNPFSGRQEVEGREIWSSDLDRAGWTPGLVVMPLTLPAPELTPGSHEVELEILDLRGRGEEGENPGAHGYFAVTVMVVADEPWPIE